MASKVLNPRNKFFKEILQKGLFQGRRQIQQVMLDILQSRLNFVDKDISNSIATIENFDKLRTLEKKTALITREELNAILN